MKQFQALIWIVALAACTDSVDDDWQTDDINNPGVGNLIVDPCGTDFGILEVGQEGFQGIRLRNAGEQPVTVSALEFAAPFQSETELPIEITAGSSRQFTLTFAPGAGEYGLFEGILVVRSDDPDSPEIECALTATITTDADGDGYDTVDAGGDDCDDADPAIHPGAEEIWYDGIDQDCSGTSDYDQDSDGYESKVFNPDVKEDCDPSTEICGGDCQDVYAHINPGMTEVWYDGVDQDCSGGSDWDFDGDGYRSAEYGWEDCDDTNPVIYPASDEALDRIDNNCNGYTDENISPETAAVIAIGDDDGEGGGSGISLGDLNENGTPDLILGVHRYDWKGGNVWNEGLGGGGVAIFLDNGMEDFDVLSSDADYFIEGEKSTDEFGHDVASLGDYDGDGVSDFAASSRGHGSLKGRVYLFSGASVDTTTDPDDADLIITGGTKHQIGQGLSSETDVNGDGTYDLVMFSTNSSIAYTYLGIHYLSASESGNLQWTNVDATWKSKCGSHYSYTTRGYCGPYLSYSATTGDLGGTDAWYYNAQAGGDLDGDGYHDIVVSDHQFDATYSNSGAVFALWGKSAEYTNNATEFSSTATRLHRGTTYNDYFGGLVGLSTDVDGDGSNEFWIHDKGSSKLYFYLGGSRSGYSPNKAEATFVGVGGQMTAITNAGDWDGDGVDDIGFSFGATGAVGGGEYILLPSRSWSGSSLRFEEHQIGNIGGMEYNYQFSMGALDTAQDLDGNGTADLIFGDLGYDEDEDEAEGAVYIMYQSL